MGQLIGATIDKQNISIAHRLPDTKSKKDRFIVKFVLREKRDEFYKSRKHLGGKKASVLDCEQSLFGQSRLSSAGLERANSRERGKREYEASESRGEAAFYIALIIYLM